MVPVDSQNQHEVEFCEEAAENKRNFLRVPKISLFHVTIGIIVLFCMLSMIIWSVNVKAYSDIPKDIYILTYRNKTATTSQPASTIITNSQPVSTESTSGVRTSGQTIKPTDVRTSDQTVKPTDVHTSVTSVKPTDVRTSFSPKIITSNDTSSSVETTSETFPTTTEPQDCNNVLEEEKVDCTPDAPLNETECAYRGCCYSPSNQIIRSKTSALVLGIPSCYYPNNYVGYKITNIEEGENYGLSATLERKTPSGFPEDIKVLHLEMNTISEFAVQVKITDKVEKRFEAPVNSLQTKPVPKEIRVYDVNLSKDGTLTVSRKISQTPIFSTKLSQLVFSDQFIQLSAKLPSEYIYGLGEHYGRLLKSVNWTRLTFHNKDNFPEPDINIYGHHPFYLNIENGIYSNGVFLLNANSMDVILQPTPAITYRTIGGNLNFIFFFGPKPSDVIKEYTDVIGRPHIPPYWSFGFHLCRYGVFTANETRRIWKRNVDAGFPFDVQWNDIDYMTTYNDFTYNNSTFAELPEFVEELHEMGMRYVVMFDPGVSNTEPKGTYPPYDDGITDDVFMKNASGEIFVGKVWNPISTVFPDFTHPKATDYWTKQFQKFHSQINFDGAWIDMNEVSNFHCNGSLYQGCPESKWEDPPYVPGGIEPLRTKGICMTAKQHLTNYYNEHNLYGYRETIATNIAMTIVREQRPFVISRSTFPGSGYYAGHWSGDIASTWEDMRYSVVNTLEFNMFGIPMIGSDICGFRLSTTEELCARWYALGGFYPFARNHNDINRTDQDPAGLGERVATSAMYSLYLRYQLLPYLYTLFFRSHIYGETVVRPLFFEFPEDSETYSIDDQFMWGSALMIMPVLHPNVSYIIPYFPKGRWHSFNTKDSIDMEQGDREVLPANDDKINLYIQGGNIIPLQHANTTTTKSRMNQFYLIAGLDKNEEGSGELYWDDGESSDPYSNKIYNHIQFFVKNHAFNSIVQYANYNTTMTLDYIKLCTLEKPPTTITINNEKIAASDEEYDSGCLTIHTKQLSLLEPFRITWD